VSSRAAPATLQFVSPVLAAALLVGVAVEKAAFHTSSADADAYHQTVRDAARRLTLDIGPWHGFDADVTPAAIALLRPNVIINREYRNEDTGERASVLMVHCRDARDLLGHFPPVCYPAHGYTLDWTDERDWSVEEVEIRGRRYRFTKEGVPLTSELHVDNFMILPHGTFARDMEQVDEVAQGIRARFYGAAQIQVLTDPDCAPQRRDEILAELLGPYLPVIRAIGSGGAR
jgi:hypothetical protein